MNTLRARLFAYIVIGVLISTTLTVVVGYVLVQNRQSAQAERALGRQATTLASVPLGSGPRVFALASKGLGAVTAVSAARARRILAAIGPGAPQSGQITVSGKDLLFAEREGPSGPVVLVRSANVGPGDTPSFLLSLILAGIGGAVVAAVLAAILARRLARPLAQLAQASERLAEADEPVQVELASDAPEEVRLLGRAFNQMSRQVIALRNAQRRFLLSISHELKTPLTAIKAHAEGLQDGAVEPGVAGDVIGAESARLERLISDLIDLARLDQHAFTVSQQPVDLEQVADQLTERFGASARELGVALGTEHSGEPRPVLADPDRVLQVASNLVENALRATPHEGTVTIRIEGPELSVLDTGPGLAAEDLPRAFERFYLHEKLTAHEESGSGLGLAIVKELTEAMGGTATVHSLPGEGSRFTILLPVADAAPVGAP
ncbi:MAG TPA: HAMP domain-containing sensor histidine kinase [Solirubrobacteraceae bacterium]|nr:HAMP domain-containing sensor histidine kinase [Solirubrobacteraceae bacterium]